MCGIVGYIGHRKAAELLLEGLFRLEYRGYDSAGVAIHSDGTVQVRKAAGRVQELARLVDHEPVAGNVGIGHTRWATHGKVTNENSHPHVGGNGEVVIVHNGVIENYDTLKTQLQGLGYVFRTETDTEAVAHLLAHHLAEQIKLGGDPEDIETYVKAVEVTLTKLKGTYGIVALFENMPNLLITARLGSPLVVGIGDGEFFVASDASPLVGYADEVHYLADHELIILQPDHMDVRHRDTGRISPNIQTLEQVSDDSDLGDYEHYMLKEIFEQPRALENAIRGRIDEDQATARLNGLDLSPRRLRQIDRIVLTACGTSWHAALVGEYLIEEFARIPVEVEYASELRYRNSPMTEKTMVFAITQSGETADTLAAMRELQRKGHSALAICNVVGSTIAREADGGVYLRAGSEVGVASTKAFTSQCVVLNMIALLLGRMRHLSFPAGERFIERLYQIPEQVERALGCNDHVKDVAARIADFDNFLYLGRLYNFPGALEGALKLKEISYVHAEGYPAAEMKHGPIALVDEQTPSVFVIPKGGIYPKVMSNLEEVKARGGPVIAVACEGDDRIAQLADEVIFVPDVDEHLQPIVTAIPLQLLAYHVALHRGCNVDRPRNLAKSVTVE